MFTLFNRYKIHGVITAIVIAVCFFVFLLFYRLGVHPLIDFDESIYAQIAKEALVNHHLLSLSFFGDHWFEKPPLAFWLVAASYKIFGISEFAARLPSAIGGLLMFLIPLRWVYEIRKSYAAVLLTAACAFVMFPLIYDPYFLNVDTIVGVFVILALYSWWKAQSNRKWYLIFGASIGLGVMTKSIVGLFPLAPIIIFQTTIWNFAFLKNKYFWYGTIIAASIIAPWHIYMSAKYGQSFWKIYLIYQVFKRFSSGLETNGEPFLYFFGIIFYRYYVASVLFGGALLSSLAQSFKNLHVRYLVISGVVILLIFSFSITKIPSYVAVILPVFVMLAGIALDQLIRFLPKQYLQFLVAALVILTFAYTGFAFNQYKLAQGESAEQYLANKKIGMFLKDYRRDLPVYMLGHTDYEIQYYANRKIEVRNDLNRKDFQRVIHTNYQSVFLQNDHLVIAPN